MRNLNLNLPVYQCLNLKKGKFSSPKSTFKLKFLYNFYIYSTLFAIEKKKIE